MDNTKALKIIVGVVIVIILVVIAVFAFKVNNKEGKDPNSATNVKSQEEFVNLAEDGTKENISPKLKEVKKLEGLDVSNIRITTYNNQTQLLADVVNNTAEELGGFNITITVYNKKGDVMTTTGGYVDKVAPGQKKQINSSTTADFANAYDIKIEKKADK